MTAPERAEGQSVETLLSDPALPDRYCYPSVIEAEYDALTDKELARIITEAEATRLQEICNIIEDIDRVVLVDDIRTRQLNKIEAELEQLRIEIEALPDL